MSIKNNVLNKILNYTKTNYTKVDHTNFQIGDCPCNLKCHLNSIQKIKEGKAVKVYSCIAINKIDGGIYIHFINKLENEKFQDNTWGWVYEEYDYYLVKELNAEEEDNIGDYFTSFRSSIIDLNSTKFDRIFGKINYKDFI